MFVLPNCLHLTKADLSYVPVYVSLSKAQTDRYKSGLTAKDLKACDWNCVEGFSAQYCVTVDAHKLQLNSES